MVVNVVGPAEDDRTTGGGRRAGDGDLRAIGDRELSAGRNRMRGNRLLVEGAGGADIGAVAAVEDHPTVDDGAIKVGAGQRVWGHGRCDKFAV